MKNTAKEATAHLLKLLADPDKLVEATALRMIATHRHSRKWSLRNQFLMFVQGASDAATYRAWKSWGRKVINYDTPIWIIAPVIIDVLDEETGKKRKQLVGFRDQREYAIENTEVFDAELWATVSPDAEKANEFLGDMTATYEYGLRRLNLDKLTANGGGSYYSHPSFETRSINLGHMEEQVFLHEYCHAIDHFHGTLTEAPGQQPDNELVAEVASAAVMLARYGETQPLRAGCLDYIRAYSGGDDILGPISKVLTRIERCVDFIMEEEDGTCDLQSPECEAR